MNAARILGRYTLAFIMAAAVAGVILLLAVIAFCEVILRQERSETRSLYRKLTKRLP